MSLTSYRAAPPRDKRWWNITNHSRMQWDSTKISGPTKRIFTRPRLLLLDEPTEGVQPSVIGQIGSVISRLRDRGDLAILLVEQYFDFAYALSDRFFVMRRGAVVLDGAKTDVSRSDLLAGVSV